MFSVPILKKKKKTYGVFLDTLFLRTDLDFENLDQVK